MGLQVFLINADGTSTELHSDGPVKDILFTNECYIIVVDDVRKIYLWKGIQSSVRSKFIGARLSQEIRGQVGLFYTVIPLDQGEETNKFIKIIGGKTEAGIAKGIKEEKAPVISGGRVGGGVKGHPLREKPIFKAPSPAEGMNIAGSKERQSQNIGPLYTGQASMQKYFQEEKPINFDQIMQKLGEIPIPEGYERELIIIGNHAYTVVEKISTFFGKKQVVGKKFEKVDSIPDGVFFTEGYVPRLFSEKGKIIAIEFLKSKGKVLKGAPEYKDKSQILKKQIKTQLGRK